MFSDYISGVLPELGEDNVAELSFDKLAYNEIGDLTELESRYDQLEYILAHDQSDNLRIQNIQTKGSAEFAARVKAYAEELLEMYPGKSPKEREDAICEKYGAVFIIGIGGKLANGEKHDGRAPDYDDWSTVDENGRAGLNGDILIWYPILGRSFELSSMGIRVDKESLLRQLKLEGKEEREQLYFHQQLLNGKLPLSIGGGIGQSRLCMVLLHKGHIGEIQASIWPEDMRRECKALGMNLI